MDFAVLTIMLGFSGTLLCMGIRANNRLAALVGTGFLLLDIGVVY